MLPRAKGWSNTDRITLVVASAAADGNVVEDGNLRHFQQDLDAALPWQPQWHTQGPRVLLLPWPQASLHVPLSTPQKQDCWGIFYGFPRCPHPVGMTPLPIVMGGTVSQHNVDSVVTEAQLNTPSLPPNTAKLLKMEENHQNLSQELEHRPQHRLVKFHPQIITLGKTQVCK